MAIAQVVDIVENIVSNLNYTVVITSNVSLGGGLYQVFTKNTYYCVKLKKIIIDGNLYQVSSVDFNVSVTFEAIGHSNPITVLSFDLTAPKFFHGTVYSTDKEIQLDSELNPDIFPIIYLFETINEQVNFDKTEPSEREVPIKLFILDSSNWEDNLNKEFLDDSLRPLSNVEEKWFEEVAKSRLLETLSGTGLRKNISRFAILDANGETKTIFSEKLSGIELNLTLPITRNCKCC